MFTGIITNIGVVIQGLPVGQSGQIIIETTKTFNDTVTIGDSIAIDGVCLTVVAIENHCLSFDLSDETIEKTIFNNLSATRLVNLEKALKVGDKLDGHIVQGHVDTTVFVDETNNINNNKQIVFSLPEPKRQYLKYIAPKGSITINGVSLTVNTVINQRFSVNIIPHTLEKTNLGSLQKNDLVNLEIDMFARYSINYIENYLMLLNKEVV